MNPDQIKDELRNHIEALVGNAEAEGRQLAIIAEELVTLYAASGGGQEMLETARGVMLHKFAQAAITASREVQERITDVSLFAVRLLVAGAL